MEIRKKSFVSSDEPYAKVTHLRRWHGRKLPRLVAGGAGHGQLGRVIVQHRAGVLRDILRLEIG